MKKPQRRKTIITSSMQLEASLESSFYESWNEIETFYNELTINDGWKYVSPIKDVIHYLRSLGYDRKLRAGKSVYIMLLKRNRTWEMKDGDYRIVIEPTLQQTFKVNYTNCKEVDIMMEASDLINNKVFDELLNKLIKQPIV